VTAKELIRKAITLGLKYIKILIIDAGNGIESLLKILKAYNLIIITIRNITPITFNGCRPPQKRSI
jgi:small subunit ribosomal protein S11